MMRGMVIDMNDEQLHSLAELQAFLDGTMTVEFAVAAETRYDFIARTVRRFGDARYERLATVSVVHLYNLRERTGYQPACSNDGP